MQKTPDVSASIQNMFAQSTAVLAQPSVATFERFEKRGTTQQAYIYVLLAALVAGAVAAIFAPFHGYSFIGQLLSGVLGTLIGFGVFTGAVYGIGKALFKGTGTYPEVAYTFALFFVPLSVLGTLLGIIPLLQYLFNLLIAVVMVYFGFLAVQSSMNVRTNGEALGLAVLSGVAYAVVFGIIRWLFL
ncbi:YIP1 family protein [Deinococcus sp.]|uniref:YIP1 family protein n=1 Tax=Deinococcus sp. TaxID=47478 RepID=UPI0025E6A9B6|nr:YIP1 family protein [Deinococcus sp.]